MTRLMYRLWAEKLSQRKLTTVNKKGWRVLNEGWQKLKSLENAFFKEYPEHLEEYNKRKKEDKSGVWCEAFGVHFFVSFLMEKYDLTYEQLSVELQL